MTTTRKSFERWIARYEELWRTAGTAGLATLFAEDAVYRHSPYAEPVVGLPAIAADWDDERTGPDEPFAMTSEVVAVEGTTGVARVAVTYGPPRRQEYKDLWIVRFDGDDGLATSFEEWPFRPDRTYTP